MLRAHLLGPPCAVTYSGEVGFPNQWASGLGSSVALVSTHARSHWYLHHFGPGMALTSGVLRKVMKAAAARCLPTSLPSVFM